MTSPPTPPIMSDISSHPDWCVCGEGSCSPTPTPTPSKDIKIGDIVRYTGNVRTSEYHPTENNPWLRRLNSKQLYIVVAIDQVIRERVYGCLKYPSENLFVDDQFYALSSSLTLLHSASWAPPIDDLSDSDD
jgi:hypothetical protein